MDLLALRGVSRDDKVVEKKMERKNEMFERSKSQNP